MGRSSSRTSAGAGTAVAPPGTGAARSLLATTAAALPGVTDCSSVCCTSAGWSGPGPGTRCWPTRGTRTARHCCRHARSGPGPGTDPPPGAADQDTADQDTADHDTGRSAA